MKNEWEIKLAIALITASAAVYCIHYLIFHDPHHIILYLVGDIAFVFIEVLLVTVVIHRLLSEREKKKLLSKLNMVIGAFYSEVGTELLTYLSDKDSSPDKIRTDLAINPNWSEKEINEACGKLQKYGFEAKTGKTDLIYLKEFLADKRDFMVRLLENPALLEHETFTELLWAVFHLTEELSSRKDINTLPETDIEHLTKDVTRVYGMLAKQWFTYLIHLKNNYPYLYSLALRQNPLNKKENRKITV